MWLLEPVTGALAGVLGLVALGIALFAPLGTQCIDTFLPDSGLAASPSASCKSRDWQVSRSPSCCLACHHSASPSSRRAQPVRCRPLLVLLWTCTALLSCTSLLALLSIGVFFAPAVALALVASIAGTNAARQRVRAQA